MSPNRDNSSHREQLGIACTVKYFSWVSHTCHGAWDFESSLALISYDTFHISRWRSQNSFLSCQISRLTHPDLGNLSLLIQFKKTMITSSDEKKSGEAEVGRGHAS